MRGAYLEVGNTHYLHVLHDIWLPNFLNEKLFYWTSSTL